MSEIGFEPCILNQQSELELKRNEIVGSRSAECWLGLQTRLLCLNEWYLSVLPHLHVKDYFLEVMYELKWKQYRKSQ